MVLHGVEGWGKTSFAAQAAKPYFLMARGETGLETLIDSGQLPAVDHYPELLGWQQTLDVIDLLTNEDHAYKTLVLDAVNGFERLCHEEVCRRDFANDWTDKGFQGYMRGYDVAMADWRLFLSKLDTLREKKRMGIIALCHTKVTTFKNPEGPDFDRYQPDMHHKTWGLTAKWADMVLFGNYVTVVDDVQGKGKPNAKGKAKGGTIRVLFTERTAAYDAKNRFGLHDEIDMGGSAVEAFQNFVAAVKSAKEKNSNG